MPERQPESGRAALVRALGVRRNAAWGFALAVAVTAAVFAFFVLIPGTQRPTAYYWALAFVLAISLGGLLTAAFTLVSAVRLAREDD
ncbi:DUF7536 family protein [Halomicrobium salinisoli]|uniref:DUF7536 family protein n=1 Tax=Halomicrobium salinisoli TaxID=2878391 RepID=UPI003B8394C5